MIFLASSPASTPDGTAPDPDLVTPGTIGFLATLAVVIVTIFLIRDALRRVRRVRARSGASDAYPIPLRRHVVPNQSKLSGPETPEHQAANLDSDEADGGTGQADDDHRGDSPEKSGEEPTIASDPTDERS